MEKKEAKELTLELWTFLRDHPEITDKEDVPEELWEKVAELDDRCPLCEYSSERKAKRSSYNDCPLCPLNESNCFDVGSHFERWNETIEDDIEDANIREEAAGEIVKLVEAWPIGEKDD